MAGEDWDALKETLEILGDAATMRHLAEAERDVAAGNVLDEEQLRRLLAERRTRA